MNRTDGFSRHSTGFTARKTGNAEVCNLNGSILQQHDILWFNIAMDNSFFVRMLKGTKNLNGKMNSFLPLDFTLLAEVILERNPINIFFHNILNAIAKADVIHLDNVRM